jgi:XRE family transcriptional regulator, fatty acid utilization regulator
MEAVMAKTDFGKRLKEFRAAAGFTQVELGDRTGIHARTIINLERGERDPNWTTVIALAEALGVTPNDFLPRKRKPKK